MNIYIYNKKARPDSPAQGNRNVPQEISPHQGAERTTLPPPT